MDIDWSKAPDGATHYDVADSRISSFMKLEGGSWFFWPPASSNPVWTFWRPDTVDVEAMIPRPAAETWNGEGLPPVGTVCELRAHKLNEWGQAEIKFASRNVIVWDWLGEPEINGLCTRYVHEIDIRPIRTPEQIAAAEREKSIQQMIDNTNILTGIMSDRRIMAAQLYDAGYRKQVQP